MTKLSFLHIGKTGGSAVKAIIKPHLNTAKSAGYSITLHNHKTRLKQVVNNSEAKAVFFLRDPVSRFVSAFNSRLRQGRPLYNVPWSRGEAVAFKFLPTPNELATALSSLDDTMRVAAELAMHVIAHVDSPVTRWLSSPEYLKRNRSILYFVGFQETFDDDVKELMGKIGLTAELPNLSPNERHQSPAGLDTFLSPEAEANLRKWYGDDYLIYDWCLAHKKKINERKH